MGTAPDWQAEVENQLADLDMVIYNPRRDDWDSTWVQSADNPQFREQVEWELDALSLANLVVMYLAPGTMSPISLLELGIYAADKTNKLVVCCPEGFHRKGNVDIVCERYGVEQVDSLDGLTDAIRARYSEWQMIWADLSIPMISANPASQQFKEMYMGDFAADAERANKIAELASRYHVTIGQGPRGRSAYRLLRELFEEASWCGISRQEIQRAIYDPNRVFSR